MAFLSLQQGENSVSCELLETVQGPWEWADALYLDEVRQLTLC